MELETKLEPKICFCLTNPMKETRKMLMGPGLQKSDLKYLKQENTSLLFFFSLLKLLITSHNFDSGLSANMYFRAVLLKFVSTTA